MVAGERQTERGSGMGSQRQTYSKDSIDLRKDAPKTVLPRGAGTMVVGKTQAENPQPNLIQSKLKSVIGLQTKAKIISRRSQEKFLWSWVKQYGCISNVFRNKK